MSCTSQRRGHPRIRAWAASVGSSLFPVLADNNGGIGLLPWNDSDYVRSVNNPSNAAFTVGLQGISAPADLAATQVQIQFRAKVEAAGQSVTVACALLQDSQVIATQNVLVNQTTELSFALIPTAPQLTPITPAGWNGLLRVRFTATGTGRVRITWARLTVQGIRLDLVYPNAAVTNPTPQAISLDLLTNQIGLPVRFQGPGWTVVRGGASR